jgi:hypothetical protein
VSSISELAKVGPGAEVTPFPCVSNHSSKTQVQRDLEYYRRIREEHGQVWIALITVFLQSGRTPKNFLGSDCNEILGGEWVIDYMRVDRNSRRDVSSEAFFSRADIPVSLRPMLDHAASKIVSGNLHVFEMAVKHWAKHGSSNGNRALFMQCARKAGWTEPHSEYTQFVIWSTVYTPLPIRTACLDYFRWAFPRLLHAVLSERPGNMPQIQHF